MSNVRIQRLIECLRKDGLVWVTFDDDEAQGIFNRKGELILTLDIYHGDNGEVIERFCGAMNIPFSTIHASDLLVRDFEDGELYIDRTNTIPLLEEIQEAIIALKA